MNQKIDLRLLKDNNGILGKNENLIKFKKSQILI